MNVSSAPIPPAPAAEGTVVSPCHWHFPVSASVEESTKILPAPEVLKGVYEFGCKHWQRKKTCKNTGKRQGFATFDVEVVCQGSETGHEVVCLQWEMSKSVEMNRVFASNALGDASDAIMRHLVKLERYKQNYTMSMINLRAGSEGLQYAIQYAWSTKQRYSPVDQ